MSEQTNERLGLSDIETGVVALSEQRTAKALISVRGSELICAMQKEGFLMTVLGQWLRALNLTSIDQRYWPGF